MHLSRSLDLILLNFIDCWSLDFRLSWRSAENGSSLDVLLVNELILTRIELMGEYQLTSIWHRARNLPIFSPVVFLVPSTELYLISCYKKAFRLYNIRSFQRWVVYKLRCIHLLSSCFPRVLHDPFPTSNFSISLHTPNTNCNSIKHHWYTSLYAYREIWAWS